VQGLVLEPSEVAFGLGRAHVAQGCLGRQASLLLRRDRDLQIFMFTRALLVGDWSHWVRCRIISRRGLFLKL